MIRISRRAVLAAGIVPVLPLNAEEPWTAKKPAEWTEKDLTKILSDSPWAQKVDVAMGGPATGGMGGSGRGGGRGGRGGGGGGAMPTAEQGSMGSGPNNDDMGGGGGAGGGGGVAPTIPFVVRWVSAAPIKEAFVRARLGKEAETSQQAKDYLARAEPHYVIAVIGPPRRAPQQAGGTEGGGQRPAPSEEAKEKMKAGTLLHRKGKADLHPDAVEIVEGSAQTLVFRFAKTDEITVDDKDVEFATKLGRIDIKRKFKLKDMAWQGKLAL